MAKSYQKQQQPNYPCVFFSWKQLKNMGLDPNLYKQIVEQKMVLWLQYNLSYRTTLVHIDIVHRRLTSELKTGGPTISGNLCLGLLTFSRDLFLMVHSRPEIQAI